MPWNFQFGAHQFRNQELTYQSLYKAQNLGFYPNIYEGDLIRRYHQTVTLADRYSSASGFSRALRALGPDREGRSDECLPARGPIRVTLSLPSNLEALAMIARAHLDGWNLVVEDCPFAERFIQPLARHMRERLEFLPFNLLPRKIRAESDRPAPPEGLMFVTFPDRPFDSLKGSLPVKFLGQEFLVSIAEALLTRARVDRVFRLGRNLAELDHEPGGADRIKGRDLYRLTSDQAVALEEAIQAAPDEYLGWSSLYSRSRHYFDLVNANRRNVMLSLLRYSAQQGLRLPPATHAEFVEQLERTPTKVPA